MLSNFKKFSQNSCKYAVNQYTFYSERNRENKLETPPHGKVKWKQVCHL